MPLAMGFRDLRDFNLALLGKQRWNFITKPNSFVDQVYKACYFSNSTFLEATIGNNPSFGVVLEKHMMSLLQV